MPPPMTTTSNSSAARACSASWRAITAPIVRGRIQGWLLMIGADTEPFRSKLVMRVSSHRGGMRLTALVATIRNVLLDVDGRRRPDREDGLPRAAGRRERVVLLPRAGHLVLRPRARRRA